MKKLKPEDTVCRDLWAYPVVDLVRPRARVCCKRNRGWLTEQQIKDLGPDVFLNQPDVIKERDLMLQGYQVEGCQVCWNLENNGQSSFRLGDMDFQFHFNNDKGDPIHWEQFRPFEQLVEEKDSLLRSDMPNKLDIGLGNYCDLKCVYCNHAYSSQWENEDRKFGLIYTDPDNPTTLGPIGTIPHAMNKAPDDWYDNFVTWFDTVAKYLERIALLGGEPTHSPLFNPLSKHIAEKLSEDAHPNATVVIVSNLNWKPNVLERILEFRKELPNQVKLRIEVSMESVGEKAEFIRFGVDWERFKTNFESISKHHNIEVVPITTINGLCVSTLKEYLMYIKSVEDATERKFHVLANRLVFPKWLSINILNSNHKHYIKDTIDWIAENYKDDSKNDLMLRLCDIEAELDLPQDLELLGFTAKWIKAMDRRRNTNFLEIFPEFADIISLGEQNYKLNYTKEDISRWSP